jgi:hypothetical protein
MMEYLPEIGPEGLDLVEEYWKMRDKYDPIFGKYDTQGGRCPFPVMIKEMSDKLDGYYRDRQERKLEPELARA